MRVVIVKQNFFFRPMIGLVCIFATIYSSVNAQQSKKQVSQCNTTLLKQYESDFDKLTRIKTLEGETVNPQTTKDIEVAALRYIKENELCFNEIQQLAAAKGSQSRYIDDGGIRMPTAGNEFGSGEFNLFSTKWGANSPFSGGQNAVGPRSSGGTVTYSFMANGVSHGVEGIGGNTRYSSLPSYSSCFETEITRAFSMWSAVANIEFQRVTDNSVASNGNGASGDIRIGAHTFDGRSGILAHAFFPPPNGNSIAGDLHFDRDESWTCDASGIDIGIVATHEIGHSIGLDHESQGAIALMNPFYNPNVSALTSDDIFGARSIYGTGTTQIPEPEPPLTAAIVTFLDDDQPFVIPIEIERISDECNTSIGLDPQFLFEDGSWISRCRSINRTGSYAQFYSFTLSDASDIEIQLSSGIDTYLFLLDSNKNIIESDDDGGSGLNSAITRNLAAGRYLIEATTFSSNQTGNFSISFESN